MKTIRIELRVTAIIHVAEGLTEETPPSSLPRRMEALTITRTVPVSPSFTTNESGNVYATAKAHTVSALASIVSVLPEKLAHEARGLLS